MRITFVLPGIVPEPSGGAKIVYEYANRLALMGHMVNVLHPRTWEPLKGAAQYAKSLIWPRYIRTTQGGAIPWMAVNSSVNQLLIPDLRSRYVPDADAIVATFFRTAPLVSLLPAEKGRKFYFIQHYEDWAGTRADVDATWRLPMHKIVISLWLQDIAKSMGEAANATHVPNAMDLDAFRLTEPIDKRPRRVVMLSNSNPFKGTTEGLQALDQVRRRCPSVQAVCFGTAQRASALPDWIEYCVLPDAKALRDIYNSGSIFLQPSQAEGWGLTSTEAMACGCALVTTDNGGSRDFAIEGQTALVVPVGDAEAMADSVLRLLTDDKMRQSLARTGQQFVQQFTWDRAVHSFEKVLQQQSDTR
jgi:glycosyltransferase involved in cell wall biosynthesis